VLGSIWAVVREPLSSERDQLLLDASHLVALHMFQIRRGADAEQRLVADLVATALEGALEAASALARLGLDEGACVVMAMAAAERRPVERFSGALELAALASERQRNAGALAVHLSATRPGSVVAVFRDVVYTVIPAVRLQDAETYIETTCRSFLQRSMRQTPMVIRIAHEVSELPTSRADADRAVRVLRVGGPGSSCRSVR